MARWYHMQNYIIKKTIDTQPISGERDRDREVLTVVLSRACFFPTFLAFIHLFVLATIGVRKPVNIWAPSSEFGTYRLCEQRRFRRACASAQSRQNLCCSLIQAVSQEELSDRKPDPWPLWMAGQAQLKFVRTECSKTQIRLTRPIWFLGSSDCLH